MAHYTFDIIKYTLITEEGETYKDFIEMMPSLTVQATNYIAATLKGFFVKFGGKFFISLFPS